MVPAREFWLVRRVSPQKKARGRAGPAAGRSVEEGLSS